MTTITREQQKQILIDTANHVISRDNTSPYSENLRELARIALASLEENEFIPKNLDKALGVVGVALPESKEEFNFQTERWIQRLIDRVIRCADEFKDLPAPVDIEMLASALKNAPLAPSDNQGRPRAPVMPAELHPDTQNLVADFCTALAEKLYKAQLKYGYDADWKQDGWPTQCQAHFHQHIAKGAPPRRCGLLRVYVVSRMENGVSISAGSAGGVSSRY